MVCSVHLPEVCTGMLFECRSTPTDGFGQKVGRNFACKQGIMIHISSHLSTPYLHCTQAKQPKLIHPISSLHPRSRQLTLA